MKYFKILQVLLLCSFMALTACNDAKKEATPASSDGAVEMPTDMTNMTPPPTSTTPEPAQNAEGIWHYTCGKGCAGGAGMAGNCTVCGGPLAHNQAYHGAAASPAPATAAPAVDPPQNAAGVWHYTCGKGCAGGAGAAGTCTVCGGALAHNALYHS